MPLEMTTETQSARLPATLVIASRESRLAMWQAEHLRAALQRLYPACAVEILGMTTRGDQILDRTLSKVGGKGLFVKELENALADGRADLAVHSLKDVPMTLPDGFALAGVMAREDPRDAFVSNQYASLGELPAGAVVGTSSLRREAMLRAHYPHLDVRPLRGNLDTRLAKLDRGEYAAIILAAAGLKRLGLGARIRASIPAEDSLPAAGQGALVIEIAAERADVAAWVAPLNDLPTLLAVEAERMVSRALGGSCEVPLAAYAVWRDGGSGDGPSGARLLDLRASVSTPDGARVLTAQAAAPVADVAGALALGQAVTDELIRLGAPEIVAALLAANAAPGISNPPAPGGGTA